MALERPVVERHKRGTAWSSAFNSRPGLQPVPCAMRHVSQESRESQVSRESWESQVSGVLESQDSRESWSLRGQLFVRSGTGQARSGSQTGSQSRPAGTCQPPPAVSMAAFEEALLGDGSEPVRTMSEPARSGRCPTRSPDRESWESQESRESWSLRILGSLGVSGVLVSRKSWESNMCWYWPGTRRHQPRPRSRH